MRLDFILPVTKVQAYAEADVVADCAFNLHDGHSGPGISDGSRSAVGRRNENGS
jgi:hypothetical protein